MFWHNVKSASARRVDCFAKTPRLVPLPLKLFLLLFLIGTIQSKPLTLETISPNSQTNNRHLLPPAECRAIQHAISDHHKPELDGPTQTGGLSRSLIFHQTPGPEQPDFAEPIGNHTVAAGSDAQLACKTSNLGNYRTAWLRVEDRGILTIHNNVITHNSRFDVMNNEAEQSFVLVIRNVQPSDKGGYMCQINSVPMKNAVGYLDVLTPPVFIDGHKESESPSPPPLDDDEQQQSTTNSSQTTVVEGASATLTCLASGHPKPAITWRREDSRPILLNGLVAGSTDHWANAPVEIKDTSSLVFESVSRLSSGAYLCSASNGVQPSASKRQLLDVKFSPTITVPETEVAGWVSQREARLECLAELNPAGSHHWVKLATSTTNTDRRPVVANQEDDLWLIEHDQLMPSDKFDIVIKQINSEKVRMVLKIRQVERQDFSWYKCISKNALGLQSNFVRFYESPNGYSASVATTSSSFSFKNIIRLNELIGGASQSGSQQDDNKLNSAQNDDSRPSFERSPSSSPSASSGAPSSRIGSLRSMASELATAQRHLSSSQHNCQFATLLTLVIIASYINLPANRLATVICRVLNNYSFI